MGKIDEKKQLKRDALLNTAFELFTQKGIQETSVSDIATRAGVAKGTFYLYFKDKLDVRNLLIAHKSAQLFKVAENALIKEREAGNASLDTFENKVLFLLNNIVDQLNENKILLNFISKNLGWGYFKQAIFNPQLADNIDFSTVFNDALAASNHTYKNPELMFFTIIELVGSTIYSSILYSEPVKIEELKPYLNEVVLSIIKLHEED